LPQRDQREFYRADEPRIPDGVACVVSSDLDHMETPSEIVTLVDCDNTLLDNDDVVADLREHLERDLVDCDLSTLLGKAGSKS